MTWTDRVLAGLAELQAGRGDRSELLAAVRTTAAGVGQQLESFRSQWPEDPEITESEAAAAVAALRALITALEELATLLAGEQSGDWAVWAGRIRRPLATVRRIRDKAQQGPTSHPLVNRLLLHLAPWQAGEPSPEATRILLDSLPELEEQWDRVIGQLPADSQGALAQSLAPALEVFDAWRTHLDGPRPPQSAGWHEQIVAALEHFDELLGTQVQADLAAGPTAFPLLNLLLTAMEQALAGQASLTQVQTLAGHAMSLLSAQQNPEVLKQSRVMETLGQIQASQDLNALIAPLIERGEQLGVLASVYASDTLVDLTESPTLRSNLSLPPMLASLHKLAADRVEGQNVSLQAGIDQLEQLVQRFRSRLGSTPEEGLELALEDLATAAELLRDIAATPSAPLLEEFEEVLEDCADSLGQLSRNRASTS